MLCRSVVGISEGGSANSVASPLREEDEMARLAMANSAVLNSNLVVSVAEVEHGDQRPRAQAT